MQMHANKWEVMAEAQGKATLAKRWDKLQRVTQCMQVMQRHVSTHINIHGKRDGAQPSTQHHKHTMPRNLAVNLPRSLGL